MSVAAIQDFDAWRDLTPEQWREAGYGRPKVPPPDLLEYPGLPVPPLGVRVVDWVRSGQHDEQLERMAAPWLLPTAVTRAGVPDPRALAALARKREYLPAGWTDERNDRDATRGLVAVSFPAPPAEVEPGLLVFTARLNAGKGMLIDGQPCVLHVLGVNARTPPTHTRIRRGWHTYAVVCPGLLRPSTAATFTVDFQSARCSQFLLSVTSTAIVV